MAEPTSEPKPQPKPQPIPEAMGLSKFERRLLHTAGILLILACLVVVGVGAFLALGSLQNAFGPSYDTVSVDPSRPVEETFELVDPQFLPGTTKVLFSLAAKQEAQGLIYKEKVSYARSRNTLIYDYKTNEGDWLWQSRQQVVLKKLILGQMAGDAASGGERLIKAQYLAVTYVAKDTSADHQLGRRDKRTVRVYNLATGAGKDILDDAEEITMLRQVADNTLLVVFTAGGKSFLLVYDLAKSSVTATKVLKFAT